MEDFILNETRTCFGLMMGFATRGRWTFMENEIQTVKV